MSTGRHSTYSHHQLFTKIIYFHIQKSCLFSETLPVCAINFLDALVFSLCFLSKHVLLNLSVEATVLLSLKLIWVWAQLSLCHSNSLHNGLSRTRHPVLFTPSRSVCKVQLCQYPLILRLLFVISLSSNI